MGAGGNLAECAARELARLAWMALTLTPAMGPRRTARAIERIGAAERIFQASLTELESLGMPASAAQFIFDGRARATAEDEIARINAEPGVTFLTRDDRDYPERLLEIFDPPAVLWIRGPVDLLDRPGIAVVGTRSPTVYGSGMAEMLARDLALRGLVIQSGMARGIDTAAHKGALVAKGRTLAVWGTGIDVIYPKENKRLAEDIVANGGVIVTEFPFGTFPAPQNFPLRNRILSGLSVGVLVIEAGEHSGTRITARCAMEQNREVFAVPGNVTNKNAWGPNTLIKQGAKLTATWEDVWEDLPSQIRLQLEANLQIQHSGGQSGAGGGNESNSSLTASLFNQKPLAEPERMVFERLRQDESLQLDELIEGLDGEMGSAEIFAALFELELAGRIKQLPGKNYVRTF
ncbi:DNA processing protein [Granulicella aggregans]|uniref:DNA processing protein n=1 Tax=Granulicella aggregans TaxID=474949 RepID=A0A7W7ZDS7_9BACT|nr:DNA-processing protein DprA [Granulicella aggregans]MBB5057491.1 DNA processing protein [Granulicella aggregans]